MLYHDEAWMRALVHPAVVFTVPLCWVFGVYGLANYMTTQTAWNVKISMQVYNVVQILLCSYMVYGLMPCVSLPNIFGINSSWDAGGEWFVFVHYLSKFLDWFDTLWIILKKNRKQLSFLHVYHHTTIPMVWGYLLYLGVGNGTIRYGAWVNSLTHVIMYSHYLWTSFGLRNPFKHLITSWQITQFYSCLVHAFAVRAMEETECWKLAWLQICYQISMVYLFTVRLHWVPGCTPKIDDVPERAENMARKYVILRGQAYDVTDFQHPGGKHMLDLAIGRDATVMFESAHVRLDLAEKSLKLLPKAPAVAELESTGYSFDRPTERWATPASSELYQVIRKRVVEEVLKPIGKASDTQGARGVPTWHIACVFLGWFVSAALFITVPGVLSGAFMGLNLCWIGLAIQHTANHGGMVKNTQLGYILGLANDVGPGGSSIVWRYHHQCSHHSYCNDPVLDQDAHSSFPILRLDKTQKVQPFHQWQWIYGPISFCFLWASIHIQDLQSLLDAKTFLVRFKGTSAQEIVLAMLLKTLHVAWLYMLPAYIHGVRAMLLPWFVCLSVGSFWLASLFIVSHNLEVCKDFEEPSAGKGDWARYQIETSSSWGGRIGSFFTGGLNLQIEHHLFPCMAHNLYADVQKVVKEECQKRGVHYQGYDTFWPNFVDHVKFLFVAGRSTWGVKRAETQAQPEQDKKDD